jgi:RHS repeat-associated protein
MTRGGAASNVLLDYGPFGEPMQPASPAGLFDFAGMLRFPGSSVLHSTHRSYLQRLGRFAQQDPAGFADGLNRYVYAKNTPIDLYDPLGLESYAPMSKARIDYLATQRGIGVDLTGVNRQRAVGRWFQNILLRSFGLTENGRRFNSLLRDLGTNQNRSSVQPDAVTDQQYYKADETSNNFVRGVKYIAWSLADVGGKTLKNSSFWEFKAYAEGTVINLNDSEIQIKGMIDAASETDATKDKSAPLPSSIHIVTTSGVTLSPAVISYATARDVELVLHIAEEYSTDTGGNPVGMRVGAGMVLNDAVLMKRGAYIAEQNAGSVVRFEPNQVRVNLLPGRFLHLGPLN